MQVKRRFPGMRSRSGLWHLRASIDWLVIVIVTSIIASATGVRDMPAEVAGPGR